MRLHFQLSPNRGLVPFNYPHFLVGALHKWLGDNALHDGLSLYSLGWLQGGRGKSEGLAFVEGARWFISAPDTAPGDELLARVVAGAQADPTVCCGMEVLQINVERTPEFGATHTFRADSPIFLRGSKAEEGGAPESHLIYSDEAADAALTHALRHKLIAAGLSDHAAGAQMRFDRTFQAPKTRLIQIGPTRKRASVCPVVVTGHQTAVQFAWNVGAGDLTGCAFGSLV